MIMGIMLGMIGQSWSGLMKREREEELFFRGAQIQNAIKRYYTDPKNGSGAPRHPSMGLRELKDLLKDTKELTTTRWLRQNYTDPLTGKEWQVIKGRVKDKPFDGIIGVASTSDDKPIKQSGFPDDYKAFEGKTKYSEWQFVYGQLPQQGSLKVQMPRL
jgi:type II secretory pathway pseudopilin PulG